MLMYVPGDLTSASILAAVTKPPRNKGISK